MRLGFHYHIPAHIVNGEIYTMSLQGLFIDSLAPHCEKVILFLYTPREAEIKTLDYKLQSPNIELVSLIKHYSIPVRLLLSPLVRRKINARVKDIDLLLIRCPTPLLPFIAKDIQGKAKLALLVVGEMFEHIPNMRMPEWRKALLRKYVLWNEGSQFEFSRKALVLSPSAVLYDKHKDVAERAELIRTTVLTKEDFFFREDTCLKAPYELLYTGRIETGKGLLEITEAMGMLAKEGIECKLNIVGWAEPNDNTPELIKDVAKQWGVEDKVIFHGKKQVGEELFSYYRNADIFVLASQIAEGFPRTIWEGLANSLPVIATPVGSIPRFLTHRHDIMLVEPRNAKDISQKMREIITEPELRRNLIKNGQKTVEPSVLDVQAKKITDIFKEYINK